VSQENHDKKPISLFYSYSHKDEDLRLKLQDHLAGLKWSGMIAEWNDRDIEAGKEWEKEIDHHLSSADIILLLVSATFIASPYCWGIEIKKALERHERGEARVIPVILRPCRWQRTPFAKLQATPKDAKPVTQWLDWDAAFDDVVSKIEAVVDELQRNTGKAADPVTGGVEPKAGSQLSGNLLPPSSEFADFAAFRDIDVPWCPEMVVLPAGRLLMGSLESEEGRYDWEWPQHRVTIGNRFAIGRYPVTVGEYRIFAEATRHRHEGRMWVWNGSEAKEEALKSWRYPGFAQTDRHPVVGVCWRDAVAFCEWLSKETDKPYRLPSEAEWEYACRAGTTTRYSVGDQITEKDANFNMKIGKTTEVGTYPANPWGLHDTHGNVWEWVEDHWHGNYEGAPRDGRAWTKDSGGADTLRVIRGGSWHADVSLMRSACRYWREPGYRMDNLGFRCARVLS
jgi:formylglycine-generating enzyme required for sulfatase activity